MNRSARADVRNPLLRLPAAREIAALPPDVRRRLRDLLLDVSADARERANVAWRKHKGPMAAYWKAVAVYSRHAAAMLRELPLEARGNGGER